MTDHGAADLHDWQPTGDTADYRRAVRALHGVPARAALTASPTATRGADDSDVVPLRPMLEPSRRFTDVGNAARFAQQHSDDLRYCYATKSWHVWDGRRFAVDETGAVERLAKQTIAGFYAEAAALSDSTDRAALVRHAIQSERKPRLDAMIALAQSEPGIAVRVNEFDVDPWALNIANGILDLRSGGLFPHARYALCTKLVPIALDPDAQCPRWIRFLDEIFAGDRHRIDFVQRFFGYSLTGATSEQCLLLALGRGANGKTTLLDVLRLLLGDYACVADFSTFLDRPGSGPRNDVARLFGARAVTSSEAGEDKRLDESLIKSLTGDGTIAARRLYREAFEFAITFKIWLAANHRPVIRGTDAGIWRRIRLVPFEVEIPEANRDPNLLAALTAELPGILGWALDGCLAWQRHGLGTPDVVRAATDEYRADSDPLGSFLDECCAFGDLARESASALYAAYHAWAGRNGMHEMSNAAFGRKLSDRGFAKEKNRVGTIDRLGLRLRVANAMQGVELTPPRQFPDSSEGFL